MTSNRRFCVFILSHGRADNVRTLKTLMAQGYTGEWRIVIDDEDPQMGDYLDEYGDNVVVFNKEDVAARMDEADTFGDRRTVVYARNACFDIAKEMGLTHFLELDDDYTSFEHRYVEGDKLKVRKTKNLDLIFDAFLDWLDDTGAMTVAMAQGGDIIGGVGNSRLRESCLRKAMNSFFCRTDREFKFLGRVNEDVNTYVTYGSRGRLLFTTMHFSLVQQQTQKSSGGMSEMYLDEGTYVKSFYTVMYAPSCVRVMPMGDKHMRLHHNVKWNCAVPKILNECWKKA